MAANGRHLKKILFTPVFAFLTASSGLAQGALLDSAALADARMYTTLDEALREPERVYKLEFRSRSTVGRPLPAEIGSLVNLQVFRAPGYGISELPAQIGKLTNLQVLDLSANRLSELPDEIGNLTNLRELSLSGNDFDGLPPVVFSLRGLRRLTLVGMDLTELPPDIGRLTNLRYLSLVRNRIARLPSEIGELTNLRYLGLGGNQLTALPPEIGRLSKLRSLDLRGNRLTELPPAIAGLLELPHPAGRAAAERLGPNRRFENEGRPLLGPDLEATIAESRSLPGIEEVAELVERMEAMEAGRVTWERPNVARLDQAAAGLEAHLEEHPDDVRALILYARLGRFASVSQPDVISREEGPPSYDARYAPFLAALDRALELDPTSAEAHYWRARINGIRVPDISSGRMAYRHLDLQEAIEAAEAAVELAPENIAYREALALYLVAARRYPRALDVMRPAEGGRHPIYTLLADMEAVPIPESATFSPEDSESFAEQQLQRERFSDYPMLRVRMYVLPLTADEIETFYAGHYDGFEFSEPETQELGEGAEARVYVALLARANGDRQAIKVSDIEEIETDDAILVSAFELRGMPAEARVATPAGHPIPPNYGDIYSYLFVVNYGVVD